MSIWDVLNYFYTFFFIAFFFSLAVGVHEWGHFLAARWCKLKVDRFAIGFGTPIVTWRKKGVTYQICSIPMGGYVSLPQMLPMDAIEGEADTKGEDIPPASPKHKIIVAFAGPLFSFLLAVAMSTLIWVVGKPADKTDFVTTIGYVVPGMPAEKAGIQAGDRIVTIDNKPVRRWREITRDIILSPDSSIHFVLDRGGKMVDLNIVPSSDKSEANPEGLRQIGIAPMQTLLVGPLVPNSPLELAGVKPGDIFVSANGVNVTSFGLLREIVLKNADKALPFVFSRDDKEIEKIVTPRNPKDMDFPMIGSVEIKLEPYVDHPTPVQQITDVVFQTKLTLQALFSPRSGVRVSDLSGAIGIFHLYSRILSLDNYDNAWQGMWMGLRLAVWFSVLLNVSLAIMNVLPIPVLDGGHIVMSLYEMIRGRLPDIQVIKAIQATFVVLLLTFMLYVNFHDILRWGRFQQREQRQRELERQTIIFEQVLTQPK